MSYQLGIDIGTTYSAAAVHRDGRADVASLGRRAPIIPSVVLLKEDGSFLTGDAAERRATTEPERVVREFKRRLGDSTPIIVAGSPYSAESLTARLLGAMYEQVVQTEGSGPDKIVITHPANWGDFKVDLLSQSVRLAGLDPDVVGFITEPEAAAISYAAQERVEPGEIVAVYDLGGGTFDSAVLRRTTTGFTIAGRPEGIERLGGIDFDAAVYAHVTSNLGDAMTQLDPEDPTALAAVARLRRDCVEAKEALSSDTDATIPVMIPGHQTEVRITRSEFEGLIRPSLLDTIGAMERAVSSAELEMADVSRILLVGGSSRIPVVSQLVASQLARPVAVDTHPKHTVAVGAAFAAGGVLEALEADIDAAPAGPAAGRPSAVPPAAAGAPGSPGADSVAGGFQAGQTRLSDQPLPGPQLFHTPDFSPDAPDRQAAPDPAAARDRSPGAATPPDRGPARRPGAGPDARPPAGAPGPRSGPGAGAAPSARPVGDAAGAPGRGSDPGAPVGGEAAEFGRPPSQRRNPAKARPVTTPGLAPPPSSNRPKSQPASPAGGPGRGADPARPAAQAGSEPRQAPPKAKPVAFPGEAPPKARPVASPGTAPPGGAAPPPGSAGRPRPDGGRPPGGGPGAAPAAGAARPPAGGQAAAAPPGARQPSAAGASGGPNDATVAFRSSAPPGLSGTDGGNNAAVSPLVWAGIAAVVLIALIVVAVLLS